MSHPWQTTLGELISRVRSEYGEAAAEGVKKLADLAGWTDEEELEAESSRYLLNRAGLPEVDFGHDPC